MNHRFHQLCRFLSVCSFCLGLLLADGHGQDAAANPVASFRAANEAYSKQDYAGAIAQYEAILRDGAHSAAIYYNLGNAYWQQADAGRALLYLEKAIALEPSLAEARHNWNFIRQQAGLPNVAPEQSLLSRLAGWMPLNRWGWVLAIGAWSSALLLVLSFVRESIATLCRIFLSLTLAVVMIGSLGLWGALRQTRAMVALQKETPLRVSPLADSAVTGYMMAGERATYRESHLGYYLVQSENGKQGWVTATEAGLVWE